MDGSHLPFPTRLSLALCGLMATVPFLSPYHNFPFPTFYTEWLAFALGLAALVAMASAPSARPVAIPAMCLGLLGFTAVLVLQVALGQVAYPLRSVMGALYAVWAALLVVLGARLGSEIGERGVAHALQWWLALAGTLVAASGFVQYYHTPLYVGGLAMREPTANLMFGFIGQTNNFADYLGIALVSIAFLHARRVLGPAPALLMASLVSSAMALSGSRTSWSYFAVIFCLVAILLRGDDPQAGRRFLRFALFAFATYVIVQLLNQYLDVFTGPGGRPFSAGERLVRGLDADAVGVRPIRIQFLICAWLMFLSSPVLGVGFGEYGWRMFELAADLPGQIPPGLDRHSHNLFLQLLAETGAVGFLCITLPLAYCLYRMPWRRLQPARWWAVAVLAITGLHSMVEFPLWHANFLGVFALLFGLVSSPFALLEASRLRRGTFLVVLIAGCLTAGSVLADYRSFEAWYLRLEAEGARGARKSLEDLDFLLTHERGSFFSPYFDRLLSESIAIDEQGLASKIAFNAEVMRIYPVPPVVHRQIVLLALAGRDEDASRLLRAAVRVHPTWTADWLPVLERLARDRPERFAPLLAAARSGLAEQGKAFAPLAGKR